MKLLMENWRGYIKETEEAAIYGDLYLFEGDEISKTSFYDAINILSESDDDADRFLENWERSIDHMFEGLNEANPIKTAVGVIDDAVLKASVQAYMALDKLKGKAVTPVANLISKLDKVIENNPKTSRAVLAIGGALAFAAAATARIHFELDNSMDPEGLKSTMDTIATQIKQKLDALEKSAQTALQGLEPNEPANKANLEPVAPRFSVDQWGNEAGSPEYIEKLNQNLDNVNNKISNAIQNPELEKAMDKYENSMDQWSDMFRDADVRRADPSYGVGQIPQDFESLQSALEAGNVPDSTKEFRKLLRTMMDNEQINSKEARQAYRKWASDNPNAIGKLAKKMFPRNSDKLPIVLGKLKQ